MAMQRGATAQVERGVTPQSNRGANSTPDRNGFDQRREESGWEEREAPAQIKFEKVGDVFVGVLVSIQSVMVNGKEVTKYLLEDGNKYFEMLATFDLARKIVPGDRGKVIRVELAGLDPSMGRDGNPMRIFSVRVKKGSVQNNPAVTNQDIPF